MSATLSASYRWMMQQEAWGDLSAYLDTLVKESNRDMDIVPVEHMNSNVAAHARGIRDTVAKIRSHIDYGIGGGPK